jgi:hypothetical protein
LPDSHAVRSSEVGADPCRSCPEPYCGPTLQALTDAVLWAYCPVWSFMSCPRSPQRVVPSYIKPWP